MTHFGGVIIALKEEVKNTLCPRTPVYLQDKQPSIFAMKAVVYITELSTYFPEGSTFHLRICWIVIVITQYLRHFHRSYDNYLISFSFISPSLSTSFLVFLFFPFLFKRSSMSGVVTLLVDSKPLSVFCHMGNFGCGVGGWTPVMKINGNEVHTVNEWFISYIDPLSFKTLQIANVHVTYVWLLFFFEKVMHEEQTLFNVNFKTYGVYNDFWKRKV